VINEKYARYSVATRLKCGELFNNHFTINLLLSLPEKEFKTRMWANVQRDGRPAEYRWRPLFNAAKFG